MGLEWLAIAAIVTAASFVLGLAGFGNGLISLALLPYLMSPGQAVALTTIYTATFTLVMLVLLRRDFVPRDTLTLLVGTLIGTPLGVWVLATLPAALLTRLIGGALIVVVGIEWLGLYPGKLVSQWWAVGAESWLVCSAEQLGRPGHRSSCTLRRSAGSQQPLRPTSRAFLP